MSDRVNALWGLADKANKRNVGIFGYQKFLGFLTSDRQYIGYVRPFPYERIISIAANP